MDDADVVRQILDVAQARSGIAFDAYKGKTLARRVRHRAGMLGVATLSDYLAIVRDEPGEAALLAETLLIRTTSMFRDRASFDALREALPALFAERCAAGARLVRAWVPACSSGEEAYSIAICLLEANEALGSPLEVSVLASDVRAEAVERAASGIVRAGQIDEGDATRAARWLTPRSGDHEVVPALKRVVSTARHDLLGLDYPAPREAVVASFDLVSCRNFLIYLKPAAQRNVLFRLVKACARGAMLMLGDAELPPDEQELEPIHARARLYRVHRR